MNSNDRAIPNSNILFEPVDDHYGRRLALVFGNHAKDGVCPYAQAKRCYHCDIGFGEGVQFDSTMNIRRLQWLQQYYASCWPGVAHLLIYNSGSTLNPRELSPKVCDRIISFAKSLPKLRQFSMDSREAFITTKYVRHLALALGSGKRFGVILGVESADERIRNKFLNKKMSGTAITKALIRFRQAWDGVEQAQRQQMADPVLLINLVIGSPGTNNQTVITDALNTAHYAIKLAEEYQLPLDLNIHPYYPSRHSLQHYPDHPRASSQTLLEVVNELNKLKSERVHFFIGLQDENHDQDLELRQNNERKYQTE
ncbi:MAG: hypothetical protein Q9M22_03095 [Mariprofundaceae bacterium]|nr:hypothetical protein [Mariprofundaceae bacterium]